MLTQLKQAQETARRAARGEQGRLCLGVTSTTPYNPLVPRSIRALTERLQNESLDAAFIRVLLSDKSKLAVTPLLNEPMVVAPSSRHPLATGKLPFL
jgi:DNA-binding transcriptional LysR family regulator